MATIFRADSGRLTIAEAKRLILEASPRERFVDIYIRDDGTLKAVADEESKSIYASHLDEDFAENCKDLGIVPRWKYRPGKTGYTGDITTDDLYTVAHDELAHLANRYGLALEVGIAPADEVTFTDSVTTIEAGRISTHSRAAHLAEEAERGQRHAEGHYTMCEVAELFANTYGIDAEDFLKTRMHPGFASGALVLIDPKDGGPRSSTLLSLSVRSI